MLRLPLLWVCRAARRVCLSSGPDVRCVSELMNEMLAIIRRRRLV
jgi:hypothetical protein